MISDPIADFLTRIRNAQAVNHKTVQIPYSKFKHSLAKIMVKEGYLKDCQLSGQKPKNNLDISLQYSHRQPAITSLTRISKPGQRIYTDMAQLPKVRRGRGITILSTSQGIMTAKQAQAKNLGGEIICKVS